MRKYTLYSSINWIWTYNIIIHYSQGSGSILVIREISNHYKLMVESKCLSCTCTTWSTHAALFQPYIATCLVLMSVLFWNLNNTNDIWIPFNKHSSKWNLCVRSLRCLVKQWSWTCFVLYLLASELQPYLLISISIWSLVASGNAQHNFTTSSNEILCGCAGPWKALSTSSSDWDTGYSTCILDALLLMYAEPLEQGRAERWTLQNQL